MKEYNFGIRVALVVVLLCLLLLVPQAFAAEQADGDIPVLQQTVVGKIKGDATVYHVIQIEGTDALYLRTTRFNDLVPYLDGDGTPVTYQEFLERLNP